MRAQERVLTERLSGFMVEAEWACSPVVLQERGQNGFLVAFLRASRESRLAESNGPKKLKILAAEAAIPLSKKFSSQFLQYLVNRFTSMHLFSIEQPDVVASIRAQLDGLERALGHLLVLPDLRMVYDKNDYSLVLHDGVREIEWAHLAAGHQAALAIVAELFMRVHGVEGRALDVGGVVLIDEPELHLHPEMQERILPGLTGLFPNLQFIIATHAPPCISSIDDAWVHDLGEGEGIASEQLRGRPYGSLMTSHFGVPTDYDAETTAQVEELLARAEGLSRGEGTALREELGRYLHTRDPRVLDAWLALGLESPELEAS